MTIKMPGTIKKYTEMFERGVVAEMAPLIAKSVIIELLKKQSVDVKKATQWVEENHSLWAEMAEGHKQKIKRTVSKLHQIDWFTTAWLINAIKEELPALASLFLGWRKANNWLDRQVEEMKKELGV